jgi:hypothetical protein
MILIYHAAVYLLYSVVSEVYDIILFAIQISIKKLYQNYIYLCNIRSWIFLSLFSPARYEILRRCLSP